MKIIKVMINTLSSLIIILGGLFLILYMYGIVPYVVLSGSMEPTIDTGSVCFINKRVSINDIKENDIIAFKLNDGTLVTHRVNKITDEGIITKGDNNEDVDSNIIKNNNYVGKNIFWVPKVGYVIKALQTTKGKIVTVTFIILLFVSGLLFGENKKES